MAFQSILPELRWPAPIKNGDSFTSSSTTVLNDANDVSAMIIRVGQTGNIAKVHLLTGTVTTGDDVRISLQDVDSNGLPDGTEDAYRVKTIADGDDNVWIDSGILSSDGTDLGTKKAVTAGDLIAILVKFESYVAGNMQHAAGYQPGQIRISPSYTADSANGGSSWNIRGRVPIVAIEYDDGSFAFQENCCPAVKTSPGVSTSTDPDEYSVRFKLPFPARVQGIFYTFGSRDVTLSITSDDGSSVLAGPATPLGISIGTTNGNAVRFSSNVELAKDTWYRMLLTPTGISGVNMSTWTLGNANWKPVLGLNTANYRVAYRTDAGAWTEDETLFLPMALEIVGFDDGAGGGGGGGSCNFGALSNGTRVIPKAG